MQKRIAMTSPVNGHSHTLSTLGSDLGEVKRGQTSYVDGHSHDWIMDEAGNIEIAHAQGHAHGIGAVVMKHRMTKNFECKVAKVDNSLGLVFGYAIVCMKNGERYFDLQDEHVPEGVMLEMAADFMKNSREARAMHGEDAIGEVVFAFPLTTEVAKALDIEAEQTGLLIGMAPNAESLKKFDDGEFTGFSIGGYAFYQDDGEEVAKNEDLEDAAEDVCEGCEDGCPECEPEDDEFEDDELEAVGKAIRHHPAGSPRGGQFMGGGGGGGGGARPGSEADLVQREVADMDAGELREHLGALRAIAPPRRLSTDGQNSYNSAVQRLARLTGKKTYDIRLQAQRDARNVRNA